MYMEIVFQMQKRFDFSDPIFNLIPMVEVKNAMTCQPGTLKLFFDRFPSLDIDRSAAEKEWRSVRLIEDSALECLTRDEVKTFLKSFEYCFYWTYTLPPYIVCIFKALKTCCAGVLETSFKYQGK